MQDIMYAHRGVRLDWGRWKVHQFPMSTGNRQKLRVSCVSLFRYFASHTRRLLNPSVF